MDEELRVYKYDLKCHPITDARLIELQDENDNIVLTVPMEMFAVTTFFRCMFKQETLSAPAHRMFVDVMKALDGKMQWVVIDDLQGGRFFATIHFSNREGEEFIVQAEASDALAMAYCAPCYVYVKKSIIAAAKNDRLNRVYWYSADDEESLSAAREASHDELVSLPPNDLQQLIEIATSIEDFEFAARIKKAQDAQKDRHRQLVEILNNATSENTEKFIEDFNKSIEERLVNKNPNGGAPKFTLEVKKNKKKNNDEKDSN